MNTKINCKNNSICLEINNSRYLFSILMILLISCTESRDNETVILNEVPSNGKYENLKDTKVFFSDSMNIEYIFINGRIRNYNYDSNFVDLSLRKGEYRLLIQKKNRSFVISKINIAPNTTYIASYGNHEKLVSSEKNSTNKNPVNEKKKFPIFNIIIFIIFVALPLIVNAISSYKKNPISSIIILAIFCLSFLIGINYIINITWSPHISQLFIFVPGLYAIIIGSIGSDEGHQKDTSHEWRYLTNNRGIGGKVRDASIKDTFEHYHGRGSWDKKIKKRRVTFFVLGLIIGVILIINIPIKFNLFIISFGFIVSAVLGLINYAVVNLIMWNMKAGDRKILITIISVSNLAGCALSFCFLNNIINQLIFQIILYVLVSVIILTIATSLIIVLEEKK